MWTWRQVHSPRDSSFLVCSDFSSDTLCQLQSDSVGSTRFIPALDSSIKSIPVRYILELILTWNPCIVAVINQLNRYIGAMCECENTWKCCLVLASHFVCQAVSVTVIVSSRVVAFTPLGTLHIQRYRESLKQQSHLTESVPRARHTCTGYGPSQYVCVCPGSMKLGLSAS